MSIKVKIDGVNAMNIGTGERVPIPFVTNENVEIVYTLDEEKFNFDYIKQKILEGKEVIVRQPLDIEDMDEIDSSQMMQDFYFVWASRTYLRFQAQVGTAFIYWDIDRNGMSKRYQGNFAYRDSVIQLESDLADTNKSLDALWKINKGQTYDLQRESSLGDVTVPAGAMEFASLQKLGGMSRKGTNLTVLALTNGQSAGVAYTRVEDDIFSMVGTRDGSSGKVIMRADNIPNGSYMIKEESVRGDITNVRYTVTGVKDGATTTLYSTVNSNVELTINGNDFDNVRISAKLRSDGDSIDADLKVWLVKSENANAPYEPYTDSLIDAKVDKVVSVGKNLLEMNKYVDNLYPDAGSSVFYPMSETRTYYVENISSGEYTITLKGGDRFVIAQSDSLDARTPIYSLENVNLTSDFTTKNYTMGNHKYLLIYTSRYTTSYPEYVQVERGSVATPYTPYREPIEKPIPQSIIDLCPDYGIGISSEIYNYIDFEKKEYHRRVGSVDLGSLTWEYAGGYMRTSRLSDMLNGGGLMNPTSINFRTTTSFLRFSTTEYTDAVAFKEMMNGVMLYYELETEEIIDLSSVWTKDLDILEVEANGSVTFDYPNKETYKVDVPNTIEYIVKLSEVN